MQRRTLASVARVALLAGVVTSGAHAALLGTNLVVNGGGEAGPAATSLTTTAAPPNWTINGSFSVVSYGAGWGNDFLSLASPGPSSETRGNQYFVGGPTSLIATAAQLIDISGAAGAIDGTGLQFVVAAWLGGSGAQEDTINLSVNFLNASNQSISSFTLPGPSSTQRGNATALIARTNQGAVPAGTRKISIAMIANRLAGGTSYNNGYADGIGLVLFGVCPGDTDDGTGTGTPDGGVGIEDLLYYLQLFEAGDVVADVDDGNGGGVRDGGVGIEDLLYFLTRFEGGC